MKDWAPSRVLIADDDEGYLRSLQASIDARPELTVVGIARDGAEALELVEALKPEAVVIDLRMPRLDGVEAVRRLRDRRRSLCLIALTGDSDLELLHSARASPGASAPAEQAPSLSRSWTPPGRAELAWSIAARPGGDGRSVLSVRVRAGATDGEARQRLQQSRPILSPPVESEIRRLVAAVKQAAEGAEDSYEWSGAEPERARLRSVV